MSNSPRPKPDHGPQRLRTAPSASSTSKILSKIAQIAQIAHLAGSRKTPSTVPESAGVSRPLR